MHERTIFSRMPLASLDTCCEKHRDLPPADHAWASVSFTVEEHEYDEGVTIPAQKFALVILTDKTSLERGVELTPEITATILDSFAELVKDAAGPNLMAAALVSKVIEKFGAEIFDDERELSQEEAAEIARRAERRNNLPHGFGNTYGRRRGDHQH